MKKVAVFFPTFNEEGSIEKLIEQIFEQEKQTKIWEIHVLVLTVIQRIKPQ